VIFEVQTILALQKKSVGIVLICIALHWRIDEVHFYGGDLIVK